MNSILRKSIVQLFFFVGIIYAQFGYAVGNSTATLLLNGEQSQCQLVTFDNSNERVKKIKLRNDYPFDIVRILDVYFSPDENDHFLQSDDVSVKMVSICGELNKGETCELAITAQKTASSTGPVPLYIKYEVSGEIKHAVVGVDVTLDGSYYVAVAQEIPVEAIEEGATKILENPNVKAGLNGLGRGVVSVFTGCMPDIAGKLGVRYVNSNFVSNLVQFSKAIKPEALGIGNGVTDYFAPIPKNKWEYLNNYKNIAISKAVTGFVIGLYKCNPILGTLQIQAYGLCVLLSTGEYVVIALARQTGEDFLCPLFGSFEGWCKTAFSFIEGASFAAVEKLGINYVVLPNAAQQLSQQPLSDFLQYKPIIDFDLINKAFDKFCTDRLKDDTKDGLKHGLERNQTKASS